MTPEDEPLPRGGSGGAGVIEQPEDKRAEAESGDLPGGQRVRRRGKREGLGWCLRTPVGEEPSFIPPAVAPRLSRCQGLPVH